MINIKERKSNNVSRVINKQALVEKITHDLEQELDACLLAAHNAHLAAIDDQSVAETQYDTLAIEAGYLAEGQAKRVQEIKQAIKRYQALTLKDFSEDDAIKLSALVQLSADQSQNHWFFIAPAAGGYKATIETENIEHQITVITAQSPMATALLGRYLDDEIKLTLGNSQLTDTIAAIC